MSLRNIYLFFPVFLIFTDILAENRRNVNIRVLTEKKNHIIPGV